MLLHRQLRWLGYIIRMPDSRLPHCVLHGLQRLGHRSFGGQKKRFYDHNKSIPKKCSILFSWHEALASNRATWRSTYAFGMSCFDAEYDQVAALGRSCRHQLAAVLLPIPDSVHNAHFVADNASVALACSAAVRPSFNDENEVVVIRSGFSPKERESLHVFHVSSFQ